MATGPYTNFLKFRLNRTKPLNYSDLDNNFRFPNQWGPSQSYLQGMMVVSYDFGFTASDAISMYIANSDHTSTTINAPGLAGAPWEAIAVPSAGYIGPTGVQGPIGAQGAGSQGFQGPIGPQGNTGAQGPTGFQGVQGFQGHTGYQGAVGAQGFTGLQGLYGPQGVQGTTGAQGFTGFQGAKGDSGTNGSQGPTGFQGAGSQGFQGPTGLNGISGTSGVQGFQGPIGTNGTNGTNGSQGPTGFQGFDTSLLSINQTTVNYTLVLSDKGKLVKAKDTGAITITVPLNSNVLFPIGSQILVVRDETGEVDIVGDSGVTVLSVNSWNKLNNQYSSATLIKMSTDTWYLLGDLKP